MPTRHQIRTHDLARLMAYILGHRPDEFGLVPDPEGYVSYRELLWALHEEPGWGYVRQGDIREVLLERQGALFEFRDDRIRAVDRRWEKAAEAMTEVPPKILHTAVRRRAHAHAMEKGLASDRFLVLSADRGMALRMGRRKDPDPVLLEVLTSPAREQGVPFIPFGQLYLTKEVPARFIAGPPVKEEEDKGRKEGKPAPETAPPKPAAFAPGTFLLDAQKDPDPRRRVKGRKSKGWKEESRKLRKRRDR